MLKTKKTILGIVLCAVMAVCFSVGVIGVSKPNTAYASGSGDSAIAKIGDNVYETLETAINAVQDNETIVILKDFDSGTPFLINNGKTFTIDFNDGSSSHIFKWDDTSGSPTNRDIISIDNNSDVTVKNMKYTVDDSSVEFGNRVFNVNCTATLRLVNMLCDDSDNIKDTPVRNNGGTVILDGGDITTYNESSANLLNPVVQNLNNGKTTFTGNGSYTMKNPNTGVAWLGNVITQDSQSTDVDRENLCGTIIIENGTFNGGHIVDVNGKGTIIINDATYTSVNGPMIKTFHGGVKSTITINNITSSSTVFAQVLEELNTKIDFQNGNVKYTPSRFCINKSGSPINSISIKAGKFGPKSGSNDIHDEIEGFLADGAVISAISEDGYTYKVETPVKIANILPEDFPTTETYAWCSGSNRLYLLGYSLYVTGSDSTSIGNLNDIVVKNGNTYVYDPQYGATLTFNMSETDNSILESITISEDEKFDGTYVAPAPAETKTIAQILATVEGGFPTSADDAWKAKSGAKVYIMSGMGSALSFTDGEKTANVFSSFNVEKSGADYVYTDEINYTVKFIMKDGGLDSITFEHIADNFSSLDDTYEAPAPIETKPVVEIDCPNCGGIGYSDQLCQFCYGFGAEMCEHCDNTFKEPCTNCNKTGKIPYETLEDAVNAVANNGKITLLADNSEEIVISKAIAFTIDKDEFAFDKSKITAGTGCDISSVENGKAITFTVTLAKQVSDILATVPSFPGTAEDGWVNEHSLKAYVSGEILYVGNVNLAVNTYLTKDGSDYLYSCTMYDVKFVMTQGVLTSIEVSRVISSTANGIFKAVALIEKPQADTTVFTYNGDFQTYNVAENDFYSISGNVQKNAGMHTVTIALIDKVYYKWKDGDSEDLTFEFVIGQALNEISNLTFAGWVFGETASTPSATATFGTDDIIFTYAVVSETPNWVSEKPTTAGNYIIKASVDATDNYLSAYAKLDFVIAQAEVEKPNADTTNFVYDGQQKTYTLATNDAYTISENTTQTNVGTYAVTVSLKDKDNYKWKDGDSEDLTFDFVINQKAEDVKVQDKNGGELTDSKVMIVSAVDGIKPGAVFVVEVINLEKAEDTKQTETLLVNGNKIAENEKIYGIYDAKLLLNGAVVQPNGTITIKMFVPEELRGKDFKLYHVHNGTEVIEIDNYEDAGEGYITFDVDKLSQFAFVAEAPNESHGLSAGAIIGIVFGSLVGLAIIVYVLGYFFLYRKGKLDDKKIKVIYKFLPKNNDNK